MQRTRLKFNGRDEWLVARNQGIGASEVASVVGLNPWQTPYQLWRRKMGLDAPTEETFAMKAGHYLEPAVAQFFADESGLDIIHSSAPDFMFIDKERPYLRVSPDRTYWLPDLARNDDNKGILECKTTQKEIDPDDLPKHWFCQVQMNLGVSQYQHGAIAWLTAGRAFGYRYIDFDADFYGWLSDEVSKFWVDNVLAKKEPAATSVDDILLKYNQHTNGKFIEVGEDIYEAYSKLKDVKKELTALDATKEELEAKIKLAFGDAEGITFGGDTLATWKAPKPTMKLDTAALKEKYPSIAEEMTKPVQGARRFLVK